MLPQKQFGNIVPTSVSRFGAAASYQSNSLGTMIPSTMRTNVVEQDYDTTPSSDYPPYFAVIPYLLAKAM